MEGKADLRTKPFLVAALVLTPLLLAGIHILETGGRSRPMGAKTSPISAPLIAEAAATAAIKAQLRRLPWSPMLREAEARRGVTYSGSGAPLRRLAAKLLAGRAVKIVAIGGSVTQGGGMLGDYLSELFQYINSTFPHRQHEMVNKGMGAWGSEGFEPCLDHIVPQDADLIVVEFAINDEASKEVTFASPQRRTYEQMLRRMLQRPSQPTLLLLQYYPWMRSFEDGVTQGLYYREPETEMTVLGQYYDLPVVSLRAAAWRLMQAGIDGFKADKGAHSIGLNWGNKSVIPQAAPGEEDQYFYADGLHPGAGGARVLAELMIHPLAAAVEEVAAGVQVEEREDPRLQGLPPPMIPHSPNISSSSCYMLEEFKPLVKVARGFKYQPERPARTSVLAQKWGWSSLQPGDWMQLEVSTMLEAASPQRNATVLLTHLHGFDGLGSAALSCISGCACEPAIMRTWEPPIPYTVFLNYPLLNVTQHPRCQLRVQIVNERPQQAEHKVMLAALAVQLLS